MQARRHVRVGAEGHEGIVVAGLEVVGLLERVHELEDVHIFVGALSGPLGLWPLYVVLILIFSPRSQQCLLAILKKFIKGRIYSLLIGLYRLKQPN